MTIVGAGVLLGAGVAVTVSAGAVGEVARDVAVGSGVPVAGTGLGLPTSGAVGRIKVAAWVGTVEVSSWLTCVFTESTEAVGASVGMVLATGRLQDDNKRTNISMGKINRFIISLPSSRGVIQERMLV
jgi:hypothetical protein